MGGMRASRVASRGSRVGIAVALGWFTVASAATAQDSAVDRIALMRDLSVLAHDSMAGRLVGTEGSAKARRYLLRRLEDMGVPADSQSFAARGGATGVNVIGRISGTAPEGGAIVLSAHYDHLGVRGGEIFNGADDNASGTAGLLALAATLVEAPLRHDVVLAFLDAEESGLRGAKAFVGALESPTEAVALNLNLDMVSRSDRVLWVVGTHQNPDLRPMVEAVEPAVGVELQFGHDTPDLSGSDNWVLSSDHGPFHQAGVKFLYFGVDDHPDYHKSTDFSDRIDPVWFSGAVETIRRVMLAADRR